MQRWYSLHKTLNVHLVFTFVIFFFRQIIASGFITLSFHRKSRTNWEKTRGSTTRTRIYRNFVFLERLWSLSSEEGQRGCMYVYCIGEEAPSKDFAILSIAHVQYNFHFFCVLIWKNLLLIALCNTTNLVLKIIGKMKC